LITHLPRWVWLGGALLAFVAGMINVVGLIGFEQTPVSHMTGNATRFAVAIATRDWPGLRFYAGVMTSFLLGAIVSGAILRSATLQLGRRYSAALLLESGLLAMAVVLLQRQYPFGIHLLAAACGLQNGMAATFSGAIVRTTHMTGIFTDMGVQIGHAIRGLGFDHRRFGLFSVIIGGFIGGAIVGAWVFPTLGYRTLLIPIAMTASASMGYALYRRRLLSP
jgi:uncharacterized membrane protein YoaK (UPF0700 family)